MTPQLPTPEQRQAFAAHVCGAHSWYKHLSLLTGSQFLVFLALEESDAEHFKRFGGLEYAWSIGPGEPMRSGRPAGPTPGLREVSEGEALTLFPFASTDFNAPESIGYPFHQDDVSLLRAGREHPQRELVLRWDWAHHASQEAWDEMTDGERASFRFDLGEDEPEAEPHESPASALFHLLDDERGRVYNALQGRELAKIEEALERLTSKTLGSRLSSQGADD